MANAIQIPRPQRSKALAHVRKGILETPIRCLIYGAEKVGKSTFAAGAPKPIFVGAENGTERLDVERLQPSNWQEAIDWIGDLAVEKHDYQTLVVDPVNWLEPLCWRHILGESTGTIDEYGGGFGKGHSAALEQWRVLVHALEACWKKGMHVVLVAHSQVKAFQNPEGPPFDRYEVAMNAKASGLLKQWVDAVLFARLETFTKEDKATKRAKGYMSGARIMHTAPSAAYDAGARWKLPEDLPLSWQDFTDAIAAESRRAGELAANIAKCSAAIEDAKVTAFCTDFVEKNRNNADRLAELLNRLSLKLEAKKQETAT